MFWRIIKVKNSVLHIAGAELIFVELMNTVLGKKIIILKGKIILVLSSDAFGGCINTTEHVTKLQAN